MGIYKNKVDTLEENQEDQTETIKSIETHLVELDKIAVGTEVSIKVIQSDIGEIKSDIKDLTDHLLNKPEGN